MHAVTTQAIEHLMLSIKEAKARLTTSIELFKGSRELTGAIEAAHCEFAPEQRYRLRDALLQLGEKIAEQRSAA
jgi:hypothetical protein